MNKNIVLDLDGVIADIDNAINEALLSRGMGDYDYSHWLITHHNCDKSDSIMGNRFFWINLKPFEDAWHQVNKWFSNGYDVYIVTARRTEYSISVTESWLDGWRIGTMRPIFCNMGEKHNVINDLKPLFVVEDNPHEVKTLLEEGNNAFLRKAWYNQDYWNIMPTINSLFDLEPND
jgi:5'(3')-deoxyribonucleotidase